MAWLRLRSRPFGHREPPSLTRKLRVRLDNCCRRHDGGRRRRMGRLERTPKLNTGGAPAAGQWWLSDIPNPKNTHVRSVGSHQSLAVATIVQITTYLIHMVSPNQRKMNVQTSTEGMRFALQTGVRGRRSLQSEHAPASESAFEAEEALFDNLKEKWRKRGRERW